MREKEHKSLRARVWSFVWYILLFAAFGSLFLPTPPRGFLILTMLVGILGLILCEAALRLFRTRSPLPTLISRYMTLAVFLFVAVFYSVGSMLLYAEQRYETHQMTWDEVRPSTRFPESEVVVLRDVDDPERLLLIVSQDLGDYLKTLPEHRVRVVFEISTEAKQFPHPKEVQIGELKKWDVQFRMEGKLPQWLVEHILREIAGS